MAQYAVFVEGLSNITSLTEMGPEIRRAAFQAVNKATEMGRTEAARKMRQEIMFPATYLNPAQGRLFVSRKAQTNSLEARVKARGRATSLARFLVGGVPSKGSSAIIEVSPGRMSVMKRAFVMKLRAGKSVETKHNLGLAIRLKPGESIANKKFMRKVSRNLYLLYGPSVDQVFIANDGAGVAKDISPFIQDKMESEFFRLLRIPNG